MHTSLMMQNTKLGRVPCCRKYLIFMQTCNTAIDVVAYSQVPYPLSSFPLYLQLVNSYTPQKLFCLSHIQLF